MHTPGPWEDGKPSDAIVSKSSDGLLSLVDDLYPDLEAECFEFYGGYVIAESVAPCNKPLIKAAPKLLDALRQIQEMAEHDLRENYCSGFLRQIEALARVAIAMVEGE